MQSRIDARLYKLERIAWEREPWIKQGKCVCSWGDQSFYFTFDNLTEAEAAEKYPDNKKYCPRCGKLNAEVHFFSDTNMMEK